MADVASPPTLKHSLLEDVQGLSIGIFTVAFALHLLSIAGLFTGQMAGLALLITYATDWSFGPVFFLVNLPFYILGYLRFGLGFTLKSFACVTLMSIAVELIPHGISISEMHPGLAAAIFGVLGGLAVLGVFRHGGSLGGFGVFALYMQDKFGVQAGYVQLAFDAALFAAALFLVPVDVVCWSLFGAVILNLIIAINHRRDRYIAT